MVILLYIFNFEHENQVWISGIIGVKDKPVRNLQVRKAVSIEFAPSNGKFFFQMKTFYNFNLCDNRRNNVWQNMLRWMMRQAVKCRTKNFKTSGKQNLHSLLLMKPACVYTSWPAMLQPGKSSTAIELKTET